MKLQSFPYIKAITSLFSDKDKRRKLGVFIGVFYACIIMAVLYAMVDILRNDDYSKADLEAVIQPEIDATEYSTGHKDINSVDIIMPDLSKEDQPLTDIPSKPEQPAWQKNAAYWVKTDLPKIAVVIDDLGLDEDASLQLASIKAPLTLAYLPYAEGLEWQTSAVKQAGHELMVHMPMQPHNDTTDPGPNALVSGLEFSEFERRISWNLARFGGFVGINNHMGSKLTEDPALMVRVMNHLRVEGWMFLDSLTSPKTVAARAAKASGVPTISRDVFLDNVREEPLIWEQMMSAERIAKRRGYAIVIGHPYPETLAVLKRWTSSLEKRGIALVPISQLIAEQEDTDIYTSTARPDPA